MDFKEKVYDKPFKQNFNKTDVDEFTATRQHFLEHKIYTREPINSKRWIDFWREERRRCREGYNIGRDYITGYHYFYLNYSPILKTQIVKENLEGQNKAERIEGFPDFWDGDYDFFHYLEEAENSGNHAMMLGSRGKGKSLKCGSMLVRNYEHFKSSKNYAYSYSEEFLTNDGIISKAWSIMDFVSINTPWAKSRDEEDSALHRKASKRIQYNGVWTVHPKSYNSEIIGVVVGDRINKVRGKRGKLIIYEEIGSFKGVKHAWQINRPAMEDGKNTFGLMLGIGTGGDEKNNFHEGAEEMWKDPDTYKIYPVWNKWDEGKENTKMGYFWAGYINYGGCYNPETGISDIPAAMKEIELDRKRVANAQDPTIITRRKAEIPLTPDEVLMRISYSLFPREELILQEAEIENNVHRYENANFLGKLQIQEGRVVWVNDDTKKPIYKTGHSSNKNMDGAIVVYEHPKEDDKDHVISNRYFIGVDSYDHDESTTTSLGAVYVGDLWTKRIVAEYVGRPKTADEFYEICRRLCIYYNAKANIENHNKGIFTYFKSKNSEYLILEEPKVARETLSDITLRKVGMRRKLGTTPSVPLQQYSRGLIVKWLLGSTNNPDNVEEMNIHKLRALGAIRELLTWNDEGNFDRVDALCMLMLAWQDMEELYNKDIDSDKYNKTKDDFFRRHLGFNRQIIYNAGKI